jgi:hypothetical protein
VGYMDGTEARAYNVIKNNVKSALYRFLRTGRDYRGGVVKSAAKIRTVFKRRTVSW